MRAALSIAMLVLLGSCGHPAPPEREPTLDDFADFRSWTRTPIPTTDVYPNAVYSNALADRGAPWQLGTVFVRAEESGPPQAWLLHGMALRGGIRSQHNDNPCGEPGGGFRAE